MENFTALIALIVAILGLITVILSLMVANKKIRRENELEKARLEKEAKEKLSIINYEKEEQEMKNEILQISMNLLANYVDEELSKRLSTFVTADELKVLDGDLKNYVANKLKVLDGITDAKSNSIKRQVQKTFTESLGINPSAHTFDTSGNGLGTFFTDRVERRVNAYNKTIKK